MFRYYKCAFCGKRGLDQSPKKNRRFCSIECSTAYYNRLRFSNESCKFNNGVACGDHKCQNCGWNPAVALKRTEAMV